MGASYLKERWAGPSGAPPGVKWARCAQQPHAGPPQSPHPSLTANVKERMRYQALSCLQRDPVSVRWKRGGTALLAPGLPACLSRDHVNMKDNGNIQELLLLRFAEYSIPAFPPPALAPAGFLRAGQAFQSKQPFCRTICELPALDRTFHHHQAPLMIW
jgi:hypothetical protein